MNKFRKGHVQMTSSQFPRSQRSQDTVELLQQLLQQHRVLDGILEIIPSSWRCCCSSIAYSTVSWKLWWA